MCSGEKTACVPRALVCFEGSPIALMGARCPPCCLCPCESFCCKNSSGDGWCSQQVGLGLPRAPAWKDMASPHFGISSLYMHISVKVGSGLPASVNLSVHQSQLQLCCCHVQIPDLPLHGDTWCLRTLQGLLAGACGLGFSHCRGSRPQGCGLRCSRPRGRAEDSEGVTRWRSRSRSP